MNAAFVSITVAAIAALGGVVVALFNHANNRAIRLDARVTALWERVDDLEADLAAEREYVNVLIDHINQGKPPPPPPRQRPPD